MVAQRQAGTSGIAGSRGSFRSTWRGSEVLNAIDDAMQQAMQETGEAAKAYAQDLCPVDTGTLRASIFAEVDARGGSGRRTLTVGAHAPYALFVELGTAHNRAQPFIRPAVDAEAPKLTERLKAAVAGIQ